MCLLRNILCRQRNTVETMADSSVLTSTAGRASLADSSMFDSKVADISKDNLPTGATSYVDGKLITALKHCYFSPKLNQGFLVIEL